MSLVRLFAVFATLCLLVSVTLARPDLNAFLNQKVKTTEQLVNQARRDREVMDRYMRHYSMNREEVLAYLGSLRPGTIKETAVYAVYSVPEGGRIKVHLERLKKGEPVFIDAAGEPQLLMKCGNPLTLGPKDVIAENQKPVTDSILTVEESPLEIMTETDYAIEPLLELEPTAPVFTFPPVPEITPIPITPTPPSLGGFNPLPLALGGLLFVNDSGGGGGDGPPPPPPPVPEPATMLVLGGAVAYYGWRKRAKKG